MKKFNIKTRYLEHSGGTKFYETVQISEVNGPAMLIKRYGAIAKKMGGGQTIVERGNINAMNLAEKKIVNQKTSSAGGYSIVTRPAFGFHDHDGATVTQDELLHLIDTRCASADRDAVIDYFGVKATDPATIPYVPAAEPEEPVIRDATWGSW